MVEQFRIFSFYFWTKILKLPMVSLQEYAKFTVDAAVFVTHDQFQYCLQSTSWWVVQWIITGLNIPVSQVSYIGPSKLWFCSIPVFTTISCHTSWQIPLQIGGSCFVLFSDFENVSPVVFPYRLEEANSSVMSDSALTPQINNWAILITLMNSSRAKETHPN